VQQNAEMQYYKYVQLMRMYQETVHCSLECEWLQPEQLGFDTGKGQHIFLSVTTPRLTVGPTLLPILQKLEPKQATA
jgi:hypothetical protein